MLNYRENVVKLNSRISNMFRIINCYRVDNVLMFGRWCCGVEFEFKFVGDGDDGDVVIFVVFVCGVWLITTVLFSGLCVVSAGGFFLVKGSFKLNVMFFFCKFDLLNL